jgi:hypothetical protein
MTRLVETPYLFAEGARAFPVVARRMPAPARASGL